jgi:hypothetical protein
MFNQVVTQLHRFTGQISPACDQYVQYLLTEPTHRSLTNTSGATTLELPACHITLPVLPNRWSSAFP